MLDERLPPELGAALRRCDECRSGLEAGLAWAEIGGEVPAPFADRIRSHIALLEELPGKVLGLYRRRALQLADALDDLRGACESDRLISMAVAGLARRDAAGEGDA